MFFSARVFAFSFLSLGLLDYARISASPLDISKEVHTSHYDMIERQDPGSASDANSSGIEPEDEDSDQTLADGTGPLRSAVDARALYTNQVTATWFQVDIASSDPAASFTSFTSTQPSVTPIPPPSDQNQIQGPNPWNVDHIFELQVIGQAFRASKPDNIPAADWASATNAVFTTGTANKAIASAVTNLTNLRGIPNKLNTFKKQVFTGVLTGKGGPSSGDTATFFNFFGPAIQRYLKDIQTTLMNDVVDKIGTQLQSAGANNADIKSYFTSYASENYQGCVDFLSTWSGKSLSRTQTSSTLVPTSVLSTPTPSAVSCYHVADPDKTCEAISDSSGWCECGDSSLSYAQMTGTSVQPCAWTTLPPTTSFDCGPPSTTLTPVFTPTSTSACVVPDGCTNEAAPPGCAIVCS